MQKYFVDIQKSGLSHDFYRVYYPVHIIGQPTIFNIIGINDLDPRSPLVYDLNDNEEIFEDDAIVEKIDKEDLRWEEIEIVEQWKKYCR